MGMHFGGGGGRGHWELREAAKSEKVDVAILQRALQSFSRYRMQALGIAVLLLATSVLGVLPALLTRTIIDRGILRHDLRTVLVLAAATVAVALASGLLGVFGNWLSQIVGQNVMADFRLRLFHHLQLQPMQFFTATKAGELVSRVTNDVGAIQDVVTSTLTGLLQNVLTIAATLIVMFTQSWQLTLLSLIVVPAFVIPTQRTGQIRRDLQARIQTALAAMTAQLAETLGVSGALLVKAFAKEDAEEQRFSEHNDDLKGLQVRQSLVGRWLFMWLGMFSTIGPALLWAYGGWLVIRGQLSIGTIVAFVTLMARLYGPLSQLAQLHVNVLTSVALFRRIFGLLDEQPGIEDGPLTLTGDQHPLQVVFEHVSFRYPARGAKAPGEALTGIHVTVPAGSLVALVGPSGAGKTTLLHLVPRLHDPSEGRILIDGQDIRQYTLRSLRSNIGLVPQEPFLLHDTVIANVLYARPEATRAEVERACMAAQIHDVIEAMPEGYDTTVGERGYRLSGGEKQRIAIARVLLRDPRIVLLDEATSSLDTLAERRIQSAFENLLSGRTVIVIAHRLSTVLAASTIVVLEHGRVAAMGRHDELLAQGGLYARLYREQFAAAPSEAIPVPTLQPTIEVREV